jgi:hypothetical protein
MTRALYAAINKIASIRKNQIVEYFKVTLYNSQTLPHSNYGVRSSNNPAQNSFIAFIKARRPTMAVGLHAEG